MPAYLDKHGKPTDDVQNAVDGIGSPSDMAYDYLNGEKVESIDFDNIDDNTLANDYVDLIELIRHFKFDKEITRDENRFEKLCAIDDFLREKLIGYIND